MSEKINRDVHRGIMDGMLSEYFKKVGIAQSEIHQKMFKDVTEYRYNYNPHINGFFYIHMVPGSWVDDYNSIPPEYRKINGDTLFNDFQSNCGMHAYDIEIPNLNIEYETYSSRNRNLNYATRINLAGDFSIKYMEDVNLTNFRYQAAWLQYIEALKKGYIASNGTYSISNPDIEIPYYNNVYVVLFDRMGRSIRGIVKMLGVSPVNFPIKDVLGDRAQGNMSMVNCNYKCNDMVYDFFDGDDSNSNGSILLQEFEADMKLASGKSDNSNNRISSAQPIGEINGPAYPTLAQFESNLGDINGPEFPTADQFASIGLGDINGPAYPEGLIDTYETSSTPFFLALDDAPFVNKQLENFMKLDETLITDLSLIKPLTLNKHADTYRESILEAAKEKGWLDTSSVEYLTAMEVIDYSLRRDLKDQMSEEELNTFIKKIQKEKTNRALEIINEDNYSNNDAGYIFDSNAEMTDNALDTNIYPNNIISPEYESARNQVISEYQSMGMNLDAARYAADKATDNILDLVNTPSYDIKTFANSSIDDDIINVLNDKFSNSTYKEKVIGDLDNAIIDADKKVFNTEELKELQEIANNNMAKQNTKEKIDLIKDFDITKTSELDNLFLTNSSKSDSLEALGFNQKNSDKYLTEAEKQKKIEDEINNNTIGMEDVLNTPSNTQLYDSNYIDSYINNGDVQSVPFMEEIVNASLFIVDDLDVVITDDNYFNYNTKIKNTFKDILEKDGFNTQLLDNEELDVEIRRYLGI